jgi:hypothetical protein
MNTLWEMFKNQTQGQQSIYRPDNTERFLPFEANEPREYRPDGLQLSNEYSENPFEAEITPNLPPYASQFQNEVNITDSRLNELSKIYI